MKITYLGTAAAEGMPAVWCNCEACKRARIERGKSIRTRSQMLINDDLLVDFPMDTYLHALMFNLDLSSVKNVLITHAHMDHCYPQEFALHGTPYAHNMTSPIISVFGNQTVISKVKAHTMSEMKENIAPSVRLNPILPFSIIEKDGYKIYTLPAQHTIGEDCLIYIVEKGGKTALMFNDSGILDESIYAYIAKLGIKLDFVSFDCTYGNELHGKGRHMGLLDNANEREKMKKAGIVMPSTKYVVTHFSHNGNLMHDEIDAEAQKYGMTAAYDGFSFNI